MTAITRNIALAALLSAGVLTVAGSAWAEVYFPAAPVVLRAGDCSKWADTEDTMRCFDCLRKVWNGRDWVWANTCEKRRLDW
jgi:hypothetical protein